MKKKILYLITQSELGGAGKYVLDLVKNLKDEFEVSVAFGEQGDEGELAKLLKEKEISYYSLPSLKREINLSSDFRAIIEIRKLIRKIKPEYLHLNSSKISILGSIAGKLCRIPKIVYTAHGWVFNEPLPPAKKKKYEKLERFTAKFKHYIICVSDFDRISAIEHQICDEKKLITIHNGIKKPNYLAREEARTKIISLIHNEKFQITESDFIVGSIGNLYANKGFEYLIQSIKVLVDNGVNVKTIIIGEGEERDDLINWISQLRLEKNVILLGRIDKASELLKAFDMYVCSSVKEGLSYTVIEAMMAKLPIVATNVGGNPELITNNKEGLIIEPQNSEQITSAIIKLLNSPEKCTQLSQNAREKAEREFKIEKMVEETRKIYQK